MIVSVDNKLLLKQFYSFNHNHYATNNKYIHPLNLSLKDTFDLEKNPFWHTVDYAFFLYKKDGKYVGRIASTIPKKNKERATFGFFECINDVSVAKELIDAASKFALSKGASTIYGPYNPSINYELGTLIDGFHNLPYYMMSYNYDYYDSLLLASGCVGDQDFYSYLLAPEDFIVHNKLTMIRDKLINSKKIKIRNINFKDFKNEAKIIYDIYNESFDGHYGYVPFELEEFYYMAKDMTKIINPNFFKLVLWDDEPVGFIIVIPNLNEILKKNNKGNLFPFGFLKLLFNRNKIKSTRVLNVAIRKKYNHLGIGALLYYEIFQQMQKYGYKVGQLSWIAKDNVAMNKIVKELGATLENTYRIYAKSLQ